MSTVAANLKILNNVITIHDFSLICNLYKQNYNRTLVKEIR
jgi:hypothetical protein